MTIEASISAADTFTRPKKIQSSLTREVHVSIFGTFTATVTVQFSRDGSSWRDVESFTAPTEQIYTVRGPISVRAGIKTGDYTSGTVSVEIT